MRTTSRHSSTLRTEGFHQRGVDQADRPVVPKLLKPLRQFPQVVPGPPFQPAPAKEGVSITQWDKDGVEDYGLVKIDLLGNRSLAVVRDSLAVLGDRAPAALHWNPRLDPATQDLLAKGDSIGVFYAESPATRQLQQRVDKGDFETLVIHSSLISPAANRWIDTYVKRSRGEEVYAPSHPVLCSLLSDSYGCWSTRKTGVRQRRSPG